MAGPTIPKSTLTKGSSVLCQNFLLMSSLCDLCASARNSVSRCGAQRRRGRGARMRWLALLIWFSVLLPAMPATAQRMTDGPGLPTPRLYVVMPSGGRIGSTIEATVTGADIDEPQGLLFSQPGI